MTASSLQRPIPHLMSLANPGVPSIPERLRGQFHLSPPPVYEQADLEAQVDLIQNTPLFAELTDEEQQVLGYGMRLKSYTVNQTLFAKNEPSDVLYLIQEGWAKVSTDDGHPVITALGPGSMVGEIDFFLGRPHQATARAASDLMVWALDNTIFTRLMSGCPQLGLSLGLTFGAGIAQFQDLLARQMAQIPLLQNLSSEERQLVARHLSPQRFIPRETIYRSGDAPSGIFFIEEGQVWLLSDKDTYIELGPGQAFGDRAVIANRPHTYTAQAASEVVLWQLSPADFADLSATYPALRAAFNHNLQSSLAESLNMASLIIENEIKALWVVGGRDSGLVQKLRHVRQTLAWLMDSPALLA